MAFAIKKKNLNALLGMARSGKNKRELWKWVCERFQVQILFSPQKDYLTLP